MCKVGRVGIGIPEIPAEHRLEFPECAGFDIEAPLKAGAGLERGNEEAVTGGIVCGNEPCLQSLQEVESSKGCRGRWSRVMECMGDEMRQGEGGSVGGRRWRLVGAVEEVVDVASVGGRRWRSVGAVEEVVDVASTHLGGLLVPVVWILSSRAE